MIVQSLVDDMVEDLLHFLAVGKKGGGDTADSRGRCGFRGSFRLLHLLGLALGEQIALGIGEVSRIAGIVAALGVDQDAIFKAFAYYQQAVGDTTLHTHQVRVFP